MKTQCPECGAVYTVDESATGKRATCQACKSVFQVAMVADDASPQDEQPEMPVLKRRTWKEAMAQQAADVPQKMLEHRAAEQNERLDAAAKAERRIGIPVVTTETIAKNGASVVEHLGIVCSRRLEQNVFFGSGIDDLLVIFTRWDGMSTTIYTRMEEQLLDDLRNRCQQMGGNGIVSTRLHFDEVAIGGRTFLAGFAQGTAVRTAVPND